MGNIAYWIASLILSLSAILSVYAMLEKQKDGKGKVFDYLAVIAGSVAIFSGAFIMFLMLGEFTNKISDGSLGTIADLFTTISKKMAAEAKSIK